MRSDHAAGGPERFSVTCYLPSSPERIEASNPAPGVPFPEAQAYFLPSFEQPGTGEIAFGSGGVDLAEDAEVIVHEYGHAIQGNQVPGLGSTFETLETFSLEEGWSDFFAGAYLSAFSEGYGDACLGEWVAQGAPDIIFSISLRPES